MPEFAQLLEGYQRFRSGDYEEHRERWEHLAEGQQPPVMIIGCCDSRVDPATIFDTRPGQAFVLRNVANLVPPYETGGGLHGVSAAIEFAVAELQVRQVVILGHAACGGVAAALRGGDIGIPGSSFIDEWVSIIGTARERLVAEKCDDLQRALELEAVRISLRNLRTFPFVDEREKSGLLTLRGAFFAISDGVLHLLDERTGQFSPA
jgi:carbonic anhydrase